MPAGALAPEAPADLACPCSLPCIVFQAADVSWFGCRVLLARVILILLVLWGLFKGEMEAALSTERMLNWNLSTSLG